MAATDIDAPPLSWPAERLAGFLRRALPDWRGALTIRPVAGGQSNPTYFVACGERRLVLRKQPEGDLLPSAHAVDREFRVMRALAASDVPVPPTLLYVDDRDVIGTPFYLMERVHGRVIHDGSLPGLSPPDRRALYLDAAGVLARLHRVDWRALGLADYGRPTGYFERQIARWTKQWRLSGNRDQPDIERLIAWLPANVPADETAAIVHGDFRMGNLIVDPSEPRIVAVLDWELSTIGHPLADLAHSAMIWRSRPEEYGGLLGLDLERLGLPTESEYLGAYYKDCGHRARMSAFHMAFALFRFAVIFEGIAARARSGSAASADAHEVGRLADAFARRAIEAAEERPHV